MILKLKTTKVEFRNYIDSVWSLKAISQKILFFPSFFFGGGATQNILKTICNDIFALRNNKISGLQRGGRKSSRGVLNRKKRLEILVLGSSLK